MNPPNADPLLIRRAQQLRAACADRIDWLFLLLAAALFGLWPEIDLWVSAQFFDPLQGGFPRQVLWAWVLYRGTSWISLGLAAAILLIFTFAWRLPMRTAKRTHRKAGFLLLAILLGPGLMVNEGFKEHWGRARPRDVQEFHGQRQFTPATRPTAQCRSNCSFVSGHAASGFALMALAWVTRRRQLWLSLGLLAGTAVGLARIAVGGHFLSDVVFSGLVVWFSLRAAAWIFVRRRPEWALRYLRSAAAARDRV